MLEEIDVVRLVCDQCESLEEHYGDAYIKFREESMAIEILSRGEIPADKIYIVYCHECKSQLRFTRADTKTAVEDSHSLFLTIDCPVCGVEIDKQVRKK